MTEQEKMLTAYHEGGHALVALSVPATDPVHKATIIPRGRALGLVMRLPEGDRLSKRYIEFTSDLAVAMGGRVAEELIFGKENITSGASSDIEQATRMARAMERWARLAEPYRSAAREAISRVAVRADLSDDLREVVNRALEPGA
jgi:cell division protease FtsH